MSGIKNIKKKLKGFQVRPPECGSNKKGSATYTVCGCVLCGK